METKGMLKSVTIWGSLLSIVTPIIELASSGALGPKGVAIGTILGGILAAYGRLNAKKELKGVL